MEGGQEFNLLGQKVGHKGREVRDRLLAAARALMASQPTSAPTLAAISTLADVRLSAVYRYWPDVGALYIDAMAPFRAEMGPLVASLERQWPNGDEYTEALSVAEQHFAYWSDRRGALFLRNSLAEGGDRRFISLRTEWAFPLYRALADKLAAAHGRDATDADLAVAGVVVSGMERTTTLALQQSEGSGSGTSSFLLQGGKQETSVAHIITTLLRHDYLLS